MQDTTVRWETIVPFEVSDKRAHVVLEGAGSDCKIHQACARSLVRPHDFEGPTSS